MTDADTASDPTDAGNAGTETPATKADTTKTAKKVVSKTAPKSTTRKAATKKTAAKKSAAKKAASKKAARKATAKKSEEEAAENVSSEAAPDPGVESETAATPAKKSRSRRRKSSTTTTADADDTVADSTEATEAEAEPTDESTAGGSAKKSRRRGRRRKSDPVAESEHDDGDESEAGDESTDDGESESNKPATKKSRARRDRRWPDRLAIEVTPTGPRAEKGSRLMLVDDVPGESCRIAILEKGRLEELFVERAQSSTAVGNIYKARVVNVESAIQAAFVDYGSGMNGFLHVSDLHPRYFPGGDKTEKVGRKTPRRERPPIQEALKKGQEILVQVLKQGVGTKGPTVTSYLSIPGRLMVMMPGMDRVGVSRKVDDDQREKMRKILDQLDLPEGFGFILRTAGYDRTKTELKRDVAYLRRLWDQLEKRMSRVGAPSELYTEGDLLVRTIRDVVDDSIGSIVINSDTGFERARTFLEVIAPRSGPTVRHYDDAVPLFDAFGVEPQIDMIHAREVPLKSGGALVIDQTEAMVAIDVNSGRSRGAKDAESNAVSTNREAVDEIARQLRLRDQGGLVVCDLIDMRFSRNRKEIEERLATNLARDRARTTFLPISEFGLVEMTRQRIRPSIRSQYFSPCPACHGLGEIRNADSVAADAIRRAARYLAIDQVHRVELVCGARVASAILAGHRRRIDALERQSGGRVDVRISDQLPGDRFDVYAYDDRNADLDLGRLPKVKAPDPESLPTEILEPEDDGSDGEVSVGRGRGRRRRRRKPAPADVVSIAMAGGFDDFDDDDDDEPLADDEVAADGGAATDEGEGDGEGGRRRRRRRRRRRGRGGEGEPGPSDADATTVPEAPTEPARVHELAKELDVKSREILDAVAERIEGLDLKGAMSWIPAEHVATVRGFFVTEPAPTPSDESTTTTEPADDDASASTDGDATGDDGEPSRKRRRRRRRGGRRRRGRGDDADSESVASDDHESADDEGQSDAMPDDDPDANPSLEPAGLDDADSEPSDDASDDASDDGGHDDPPPAIVETTAPAAPKPRRSLYGGRFQRLGGPPPGHEDR